MQEVHLIQLRKKEKDVIKSNFQYQGTGRTLSLIACKTNHKITTYCMGETHKRPPVVTYLGIVFYEVEEHNIFALEPDGGVQWVAGLGFEHTVQQRSRHVGKVLRGEIVLQAR